jgi:hypothetical protein
MALFGAPTAHEDDPERAVRAALAIREFALEEALELRVGVTTGEALVRLDAQPGAGESMASGDVVNTAARLQSAAPVNGILADETTYRATRQVIAYEEAPAVEAKGKSEPIRVWEVSAARSRFGVDVAHEARSELVGRERELAVVEDAFDRARHARTPQLLTLVGVPGVGKSRLVCELQLIVDADPELITWRQGRCLAYGDGVTLWALAEIVKAQAGIAEQDDDAEVAAKLGRAATDVLPDQDATWVESHLLALVGLAEEPELGGNRRNEAFSAWRRFLEGLAEQRPTVLVFEDLHWADEALLDFVDELVNWLTDIPLLVVATARPELLERRPNWGGGKLNATTLALAPLSDEETAKLLGAVLGSPVLQADTQAILIERAGGNPLYAEQFAELYVERGSADELNLPETLQGIIAARLDGLGADEKALMLDAAIVGKVFWTAALGRDETTTTSTFHSLERKGFVRRQRRSSVEGHTELAFAHALVRDVAYGQIPRVDRATKHRRVAEWIESLGRPEDHAEMRAYHWRSALELTRASGGAEDGEVAERVRSSLRDAGDRAFALNSFLAAERYYADAIELWPSDESRVEALFKRAHSLYLIADERQRAALEDARDAALAADAQEYAAQAEAFLAHVAWHRGESDLVRQHLERAAALVGGTPSAGKARVLCLSARMEAVSGDVDVGLRIAEEALEMADSLGLDELRAHALATIGAAKTTLGDASGITDQERALEIALEIDSPIASTILNNLAVAADGLEGDLFRTEELQYEAQRLAQRFGDQAMLRFGRGNLIWVRFERGHWDDSLAGADEFIAQCETGSPHTLESFVRVIRGRLRLGRDDVDGSLDDLSRAAALAREVGDEDGLGSVLAVSAAVYAALERWIEAEELVREVNAIATRSTTGLGALIPISAYGYRLDGLQELRALIERWPPHAWNHVTQQAIDGNLIWAADRLRTMGATALEALMRLVAGSRMVDDGHSEGGTAQLLASLEFHRSVEATFWIRKTEKLLAEAQSESA